MCPEVAVGTGSQSGWRPGTTLTMKCTHHLGPGCALQGVLTRPSMQPAQGCALQCLCGRDVEEV